MDCDDESDSISPPDIYEEARGVDLDLLSKKSNHAYEIICVMFIKLLCKKKGASLLSDQVGSKVPSSPSELTSLSASPRYESYTG